MPNLARSVPKPLKVPSLARFVPKPLKVPCLARSMPKPLKVLSLARSVPKPCVGEAEGSEPKFHVKFLLEFHEVLDEIYIKIQVLDEFTLEL